MLDIAFIRQNADVVRAAIKNKRIDLDLDELLAADKDAPRDASRKLEQKRARKNEIAQLIPKAIEGGAPDAHRRGQEREGGARAARAVSSPRRRRRFDDLMLRVPSIPRPEVPIGDGEEDNVEIRKVGTPRTFDFKPKDHVELMTLHRHGRLGRPAQVRRRSLVRAHGHGRAPRARGHAPRGRHRSSSAASRW